MEDFILAVEMFFKNGWEMLVGIEYPGTNLTIAMILIGSACAVVSLRFFGYVIGVNYNIKGVAESFGGNNRKIRISDKRKNDSK